MPYRRIQALLLLSLICLLSFVLRNFGWDWDNGTLLHPDERHVAMVTQVLENSGSWFDTENSGFNPYNHDRNYVYGMLPLKVVHNLTVARGNTSLEEIVKTGRFMSALWSTGTVALVFLFGWRLVSVRFASQCSLLYCFTVFSIQQAHFYTVDSAGVFFSTLTCGLGLMALKENRNLLLPLAGAGVGLAMACRLNLGLLAVWMVLLTLASAWKQKNGRPFAGLAGGGFLALLLFRICQPYAFSASGFIPTGLNPDWMEELQMVRMISEGTLEVPFTLQWVGRVPWLYALQQMVLWGMGLPLGLFALAGSAGLLWHFRHRLSHWQVLLVVWPLILIAYHGGVFLHTLRYFLPAYPFLIAGGVLALRKLPNPDIRKIIYGAVIGCSCLYSLSFVNMYNQPHPKVQASEWLLDELGTGGSVVSEHWDRALPVYLPEKADSFHGIQFDEMEVYQPESPEKIRKMSSQIDQADYLVLSSTRASYTLPQMPLRYPVMSDFYRRLSEGANRSGLKEVARFHRRPNLFGFGLNTLNAEEAFRVYDHPLVRIYEKTPVFDKEVFESVLTEGVFFEHIPSIPYLEANRGNQGWLNPDQIQKRNRKASWNEEFSKKSIGNRQPLFIWVLVLGLIGPLGFPFCFYLFPSLNDRGASVSRLFFLIVLSTLAWWPAAVEVIPFHTSLLIAGMILTGISLSLIALNFQELWHWLKRCWKTVVWSESLQWILFFGFLWLRVLQPDLWHPWAGGEKPMDFAYLNATAQTPFFPPPNPWLSGAFINYYYFGFVMVATLVRLTGITPDIAYNLALPTFALFIGGGTVTLSSVFYPLIRSRKGWKGWRICSLLTVFLILVAGNLGQLREFLKPGKLSILRDMYWNASRVIQVPPGVAEPITEFPFFTLMYGDLHAHLMALPVSMLCLLSSWQLYRRFHPVRLILCGFLLGALQVINSWDVPIQMAVFLYCLFAGALPSKRWKQVIWNRSGWALLGLSVFKLSFLPFHWFHTPYPASLIRWEGPKSSLGDLILAHGLFLIPLSTGVLLLSRNKHLRQSPLRARLFPLLLVTGCLATIGFVEFYALEGDAGRMNMVFKFYYQIWWILALLTAPVVVAAWITGNRIYQAACLLIAGLSLLYTVTAVPAKVGSRYWETSYRGLDGLAYMKNAAWHPEEGRIPLQDDRFAIEWLRTYAKPFDILLEAHRPFYQWGGRMSWHTGLPTVLGWDWHMQQQRPWTGGDQTIRQRKWDIEDFYHTGDVSLLEKYGVKYVVVGKLEEITYGNEVRRRMMNHPLLREVFSEGETVIYAVE